MARETALLDKALVGAVSITAGAILGIRVLRQYRRNATTSVVCTECGESLPVEDVLDPTVTCACVTARDSQDFW